mmetsp:Transcript_34152/g.86030  ORF Transcript_34152/g.86030 Transcript_34152/m.86030 type:complete len:478 (-) Transcript_34152:78-1511(-)
MRFLSSVGFDFNKCFAAGVPFMPISLRDAKLAYAKEPRRAPRCPPNLSIVVKCVKGIVQAWLQSNGPTLELESSCLFRRSVLREALSRLAAGRERRGKGTFYMEEVAAGEGGTQTALRLVRASAAEVAAVEEREAQRYEESVWEAAGASQVMELVRDGGKPVVFHNAVLDVPFLLERLVAPLPARYAEYKELVRTWFPGGLYDTKYIANCLSGISVGVTSLGPLHEALLYQRDEAISRWLADCGSPDAWLPPVKHAPGFQRYRQSETGSGDTPYAHEAGYDAWLTGSVFAFELHLLQAKQGATCAEPSVQYMAGFLGKMYQSNTDYDCMSLWEAELAPPRAKVLVIADLAPGVTSQEVLDLCISVRLRAFSVDLSRRRNTAYVTFHDLEGQATTRQAMQSLLQAGAAKHAGGKPWRVLTPEAFSETERAASAPGHREVPPTDVMSSVDGNSKGAPRAPPVPSLSKPPSRKARGIPKN